MMEIKGMVSTAICYASIIEDEAIEQIRRMCDYDLTKGCKIRIMPDVHVGKGCTIGTTIKIKDKVCPNIVGVDIGCGMYTVKLKEKEIDLKKFDEACHFVPSGTNVWEGRIEKTDKMYYGFNGGIEINNSPKNPILFGKNGILPKRSLNVYPVGNCAECDAINNALNAGSKLENLHIYTIHATRKRFGESKLSCENCTYTFKDKVKSNNSGWIK